MTTLAFILSESFPLDGFMVITVITGNLKIITDSRILSIKAKGPKYRFPMQIDIQKSRKNCQDLLMNSVIVGVSDSILSVML